MAHLAPLFRQTFYDNNGERLALGKVETYLSGTTTPRATYTDQTEGAANTNPIILDANGECDLWIADVAYKFIVKDANDNLIRTVDKVANNNLLSVTTGMIANDEVDKTKLAADVAGLGLVQNVSGALDVNPDDSTLEISTNILRVKDLGITAAKLAADSVTTVKILDANVTTAKIADEAITQDKLDPEILALLTGSLYLNWGYAIPFAERACTFQVTGDTVTVTLHGFLDGQAVYFPVITTTTGISVGTVYFVRDATASTFKVASAPGGSALNLATGDGTGIVVLSPERATWTSIATGYHNSWVAVASAGTARTMRSLDNGVTWVAVTAAEANPWVSIAASANRYVAVSTSGTNRTMWSSDGGATWNAVAAAEDNTWNSVCYNPDTGTFIAVASSGTNRVMRSTNGGTTWSTASASAARSWSVVAASPDGTLLAGVSSVVGAVGFMRSIDDGVTWASITEGFTSTGIAYGNGVWVATSTDSAGLMYRSTDDGLTWTQINADHDTEDCSMLAVAFGNGVFVMTGVSVNTNNKVVFVSFDLGVTWHSVGAPDTGSWNAVAYGQGFFVAVGDDHKSRVIKSLTAIEV